MEELEKAARLYGVKEGVQMSRFLLWIGNECFEGREVANFMVLTARAKELVQMFLAQDRKEHPSAPPSAPAPGVTIRMGVTASVAVTQEPILKKCGQCGEVGQASGTCQKCGGSFS